MVLKAFLELHIPQWLSFCGSELERKGDHLSNDGGSDSSVPFEFPGNGPLGDDEDAHVSEGAEEEHLLGKPLEEEVDVVFPVDTVQAFQEDTWIGTYVPRVI